MHICAFPQILGRLSSYMTSQLLHSELPYIWGKLDFLFYQCMYKAKKQLKSGGGMKNFPCLLFGYSFLIRNKVRKTTTFIRIFVFQLPWRWSQGRRWRSWWTRAAPGRAGCRIRCCRWHCSPPCPLEKNCDLLCKCANLCEKLWSHFSCGNA